MNSGGMEFLKPTMEEKTKRIATFRGLLKKHWWKIVISFMLSPYIVNILQLFLPFHLLYGKVCLEGNNFFTLLQSCLVDGIIVSITSIFLSFIFLTMIFYDELSVLLNIPLINSGDYNPLGRLSFEFSRIGFQAFLVFCGVTIIIYLFWFYFIRFFTKKLNK